MHIEQTTKLAFRRATNCRVITSYCEFQRNNKQNKNTKEKLFMDNILSLLPAPILLLIVLLFIRFDVVLRPFENLFVNKTLSDRQLCFMISMVVEELKS